MAPLMPPVAAWVPRVPPAERPAAPAAPPAMVRAA